MARLARPTTSTAPASRDPLEALRARGPVTVRDLASDGNTSTRAVLDAVNALAEVVAARAWARDDTGKGADVSRLVASLCLRSYAASQRASAPF